VKKEDLIEFIGTTVASRFESSQSPTNGALLAELIRKEFKEFSGNPIVDAGYERLSDAVRDAESRKLVTRNRLVKHLEVYPAGAAEPSQLPSSHAQGTYIRNDAWQVFAMPVKPNKAIYDPATVQMIIGDGEAGKRVGAIVITTPTDNTFREWIKQFAEEVSITVPPEMLDSTLFLKEFSRLIVETNSTNLARWKKFRAQKVGEAIKEWGEQSGIDTAPFFRPVIPNYRKPLQQSVASCEVGDDLRGALIACVRDMSTAELDTLSIPIRLVRTHFRPR